MLPCSLLGFIFPSLPTNPIALAMSSGESDGIAENALILYTSLYIDRFCFLWFSFLPP
jgi:hypothetical protein